MSSYHEAIRTLRIAKGYSQEYMAEKLDMTQNNYGKLERGLILLTVDRLNQIAEILGVHSYDLLNWKNPEEKDRLTRKMPITLSYDKVLEEAFDKKVEEQNKLDLEIENQKLRRRIAELEEQLEDKRQIIDFFKQNPLEAIYNEDKYHRRFTGTFILNLYAEVEREVLTNIVKDDPGFYKEMLKDDKHENWQKVYRQAEKAFFDKYPAIEQLIREGILKDDRILKIWNSYKYYL